jgi:ankyrin repeat protein
LIWSVIAQNSEVVNGFVSGELCIPLLPDAHDNRKRTALHYAALQGNYKIYKMLLRAGWKEKAKDIETAMPIHLASINGHSELIRQFKKAFHNVDESDDNGR